MMRAVAAVLSAVVVVGAASRAGAVPAPPAARGVGVDEHLGDEIPLDLAFVDTMSNRVRLGDLLEPDKPVVLVLSYGNCHVLCSVVLKGVADAIAALDQEPGRDFLAIDVSIDPEDSPADAAHPQRDALERVGLAGHTERWPFLVGREESIRALADSLGFRYRRDPNSDQFAHPAVVFVLTPDGRISRYLYGVRPAPATLATALLAARAGAIGPVDQQVGSSVLSCFHFDPAARRFGGLIQNLFRIGAGVLFSALLIAIALLYRWERRRRR